jgi:hypothetical protein
MKSKQQSEKIVFICALAAMFLFGFLAIEIALEFFNNNKNNF